MTTFTKHQFPELPNPVYLPDWITVQIKLIPSTVDGWTSGRKLPVSNFVSTTYHDTGNLRTGAAGEYKWAANGGRGEIGSPGSYNGIFDQHGLIITQRFNELVGHAANNVGNTTSYAYEHAGIGLDFDGSWEVGCWVHAGTLQSMGLRADTSMYQHSFWSGKDCPGQIRKKGLWSATEQKVDQHIAEIVEFLAGSPDKPDVPVVVYAKPVPIPILDAISSGEGVAPSYVTLQNDEKTTAFFVGDRYEVLRETPRRRFAYLTSEIVGPPLKVGESFNVDFVFENRHGKWGYTPYGTRVLLDDLKRTSDMKGEPA